METVKVFFKNFLETHKNLKEFYPGIKLRRLLETYFTLFPNEAEDTVYIDKKQFCKDLLKGRPLEYICNSSYFYRSEFYVDERVLIPRNETEILVELSLEHLMNLSEENLKVAEIGVGSFCVGLSILLDIEKNVEFTGVDISLEALEVAQINYNRLRNDFKYSHKVSLLQSDCMNSINGLFDMVVSNPPYIRESKDKLGVHQQVDQFEPHIALYLEDNIYHDWFDSLFSNVSLKLKTNGVFFMEGHEDTLKDLALLAKKYFKEVSIKQDYTHVDRFLLCYK